VQKEDRKDSALSDVRVLDLAGQSGLYCTKLLADLGADVIKIEPPGGDPVRRLGPFYHDDPHCEKSLYFYHFNTNKRSITLNIESEDGREILQRLIETADIMVETFSPGYLAEKGLGYEDLAKNNPRLIMVSITGFGQTGPYRDFESSDLIGLATCGLLYTIGFPEDPPTTLGASQAYHMASANATIGALMALYNRNITGKGQWIDVAIQGTALRLSEMAPYTYWLVGSNRKRSGLEYYRGLRDVFNCKDGRIVCSALGGSGAEKMLEWMDAEGMAADLSDEKYREVIAVMTGGSFYGKGTQQKARLDVASAKLQDYPEEVQHIEEVWEAFLMIHTREELFVGAQERGVRLMPVNDAKSVAEDIGLKARNFFVDVKHPELGETLKYPGPPYRLSETPWRISNRAPLIGEHNIEIYKQELGFSKQKLSILKAAGVI
jgi:crotonobetainyl-CoA:carnitine CoA-transferase CaiB-like acyl-CoA transferase